MFTVETQWDCTEIVLLDDAGLVPDVQIFAYEDVVYILQWSDDVEAYSIIELSPAMFDAISYIYNVSDGAYSTADNQNGY
jgi:hypothetical protein